MKQEKLIDALEGVSADYILEAAPTGRRKRPLYRELLTLAACLALVVAGVWVVRAHLRSPLPADPLSSVAAREEAPGEVRAGESEPAGVCGTVKQGELKSSAPGSNAARETLLAYHVGELYLGMPLADRTALLGEPTERSNSGPVTYGDGITRQTWNYKLTHEDTGRRSDLSVGLADAGDGWVINALTVWADCGLALPHGVRIGMTEDELLAVWPALPDEAGVAHEDDEIKGGTGSPWYTIYTQAAGQLRFELFLEGGLLRSVSLGPYYDDAPFDPDSEPNPLPYDFSSGEITVYRMGDGVWTKTEYTGHDAKRIEVQFSIEELGFLGCGTGTPNYLVDFHNGTVAGVFDAEERGFVYRLSDPEAFARGLAEGSVDTDQLGLTRVMGGIFPAGVWALLEELSA